MLRGTVSRSIKLLWCGVLCEMRIDASGGESVLYRRDHGQGNGRPREGWDRRFT